MLRFKFGTLCLATIAAVTVASCAGSIRLHPADASPRLQSGIVYYLPTTRLKVTVPYSVVEERVWSVRPKTEWTHDSHHKPAKRDEFGRLVIVDEDGRVLSRLKDDSFAVPDGEQYVLEHKLGPFKNLYVRDQVAVAPIVVADRRIAFRVDPDAMRAFSVVTNEAKLGLTAEGMLQGVNVEFQDRSAEIAGGLLKTGISIAKLVAVAGKEVHEEKVVGVVSVERYIGFEDFAPQVPPTPGAYVFTYEVVPVFGEFGSKFDSQVSFDSAGRNKVVLGVQCAHDLKELSSMDATTLADEKVWSGEKGDRFLDGIIFRIPAPVLMTVTVDDVTVAQCHQTVAQAGGFAWVPIRNHAFTNSKFGVKVSETTGAATEYTFTGSSAGEKVANTLDTSTSTVNSSLTDLDTAAMQREINKLKKQKDLLDAKKALQDAQNGK